MSIYLNIKGQGQPMVFFHGWGFDHAIWASLVDKIQHQVKAYLVDLPGFGNTPLMSWERFKQELLSLLPQEFIVSGWSMGGLYAMRLALEEPKRVTKLLITASTPYFIKTETWPGVEKKVFNHFLNNLSSEPQKIIEEFIRLQLKNDTWKSTRPYSASLEGLTQGLQVLEQWDFRESLFNFKNPCCFLFGRLDTITPRTTLKAMEQKYPAFDYHLFQKAAHMPFLSHEEDYLLVLEEFIS